MLACVCGSGVGVSVAANKIPGIRASLCHDTYSARQGVEHDDMNILCIGARVIGPELAFECVRAFLGARYTPAAERALAEAEARRKEAAAAAPPAKEFQGPKGPEPTRYGDWERKGIASDF